MTTNEPIYLTWLNAKGGFSYFFFTAKNAHQVDVLETGVTRNNLIPNWQKSYGENADTIDRQTFLRTKNVLVLRSQHLTLDQLNALSYIKSSTLVQIVYSRNNRRTVEVDANSFVKYDEQSDQLYTIQFSLTYTDEIPAQTI
jgi:hypothetical protein